VNLSDDVVKIKDLAPSRPRPAKRPAPAPVEAEAFAPETDAGSPEMPGDAEDTFEPVVDVPVYDAYGDEDTYEPAAGGLVKGEIIQGAMAEASRILEDALRNAESARAEALAGLQDEADHLRREAQEQGHREGLATAVGTVQDAADKLEQAVARFEGERAGFETEYEGNLKWLALEIASKVLAKKVGEDDTVMLEMVDKAVQGVRNEAWVRVDVAQEMVHLIDQLTQLYAGQDNIGVSAIPATPGTVHIETPSGMVDASLRTQLSNLREYFDTNLTENV